MVRVEGIREEYCRAVNQWRSTLDRECRERLIDRVELTTADPLDQALVHYLITRGERSVGSTYAPSC